MSLRNSRQADIDKSASSEGNPEFDKQYLNSLFNAISTSPLYPIVQSVSKKQSSSDQFNDNQVAFATLFLLSFPTNLFTSLSPELVVELEQYRDHTDMSPVLKQEAEK